MPDIEESLLFSGGCDKLFFISDDAGEGGDCMFSLLDDVSEIVLFLFLELEEVTFLISEVINFSAQIFVIFPSTTLLLTFSKTTHI